MRETVGLAIAALLTLSAVGCTPEEIPDVRIGLNQPPPGTVSALAWNAVTGASAYQVIVSLDRGLTDPIGVTGFTSGTFVTLNAVAWRPGHPIVGRPYFWVMRAYDRPDPQGLLLTTSNPQEITIQSLSSLSAPVASPLPSPSPTAAPSPGQ